MKIRLLLLFIICQSAFAQITPTEVDKLMEDAISKFHVAGAAIAIVKDGKVIHSKGYGVKSINTGEKVNEHTQFAIASNSKAFTAAALAILVEEGKLSWTDKVKDHIPEFKMYNDYVTQNFNIQDLLTHRSGLGLGAGDLMFFPDGSDFKMKDILTVFQYFEPQSAFRTKFDYDNILYVIAGEVIARASGMTWEQFIQQRIFIPLEMDNSYASLAMMQNKGNLASPHDEAKGKLKQLNNFNDMINGAAGGIYSNVDDISQWMLMHLNKGKYGADLKKQLFTEVSQREMWRIHTVLEASPSPRYNSHFAGYGLGWGVEDIKGALSVSHTGGLPGMLSKTTMIPDLNLGIVILTNTSEGGAGLFEAVTQTILDNYLGLDKLNWVDRYSTMLQGMQNDSDVVTDKVWETVKKSAKQKVNTQDYIGVYEDRWFGKVEIFMKDKQLWFKSYRSPKLNGPMYFYKANSFAVKWEYQNMNADAFTIFSLDEEGKAQGLKMKGISPNIDFSFDFHDLNFKRIDK